MVQEGFICLGSPSHCLSQDDYEKSLETASFAQKRACRMDHQQEFVVTDASSGAGECQERPELTFEETAMHVNQLAVINGSALSGAASAINRVITTLTDPVAVDPAVDANGNRGAQPYAVCRSFSQKMCLTNRLPNEKGLERVCRINADVRCVEVAVETRFCGVEGNDVKGVVEKRRHDGRTSIDGEVCVFKNCNVPTTWTTPEGAPIDPNAWCFPIAAQTGSDTLESEGQQ